MKIGKQVVIYGASVALNRGGILLCTPLLVGWFGLVEFGIYSLAIVGSQLLAGLLSMNGGIAVMREGAEDERKGAYLYRKFTKITAFVGFVSAAIVWPLDYSSFHWVLAAVLLGTVEGMQQLLLNWLRCRHRQLTFLLFCVSRTAGLLLLITLVYSSGGNLELLFLSQFVWCLTLCLSFSWLSDWVTGSVASQSVELASVFRYAIPMLPHAVAQWVINGSDRLIVKSHEGEQALGVYSLAYSFAMVVMLVNSGMALALPQQIVQNYDRWTAGVLRGKVLNYYTFVVLGLVLSVLCALELDRRFLQLLPAGTAEVPVIVGLVAAGLYLQGIYYLYGNFYFYHRKTGKLAVQTAVAAGLNVVLTLILVRWFGILGAAGATFLTYLVYLCMLIFGLRNIEPRLTPMVCADFRIVPASVAGLFLAGVVHGYCWK